MRIRDRVVLITGASDGIGAACAEVFRKRGARLALVARSREKLLRVSAPDDLLLPADLVDPSARPRVVARTLERFGRIDILVNNAGVGLYAPSWRAPDGETRAMFELNLFAPLELAQLAAPGMIERREGLIVNVGSLAGKVALPWLALYSASKCALGSLSDGMRMELKAHGVHTMTVCPGFVNTEFQAHALGGGAPDGIPHNRLLSVTAAECAEAIARGVERNARTLVVPRAGWLFVSAARVFPGAADAVLERIYRRIMAA